MRIVVDTVDLPHFEANDLQRRLTWEARNYDRDADVVRVLEPPAAPA
jgi:hypothetical protein